MKEMVPMTLEIDGRKRRPQRRGSGVRSALFAALPLAACAALAAAGYGARAQTPAPEIDSSSPAVVDPETVAIVRRERISAGPPVSGELRAEHEATARAEVGGSISNLRVQEGDTVRRGQVLCRIEAPAQDDTLLSAEQGVRAAASALDVARRDAERTAVLASEGLIARRDVETAAKGVAAGEAALAEAVARVAGAREQLQKSVVRAPIAGVVSTRAAHDGDVIAPGAPVMTIIDPSRMQFVASVPADAVGALRPGATVEFRLPAYERERFTGRITRISPAVDPLTRQVQIYVAVPNRPQRLVAGLFAEGRVTTATREALVAPADAVEASGESASVLRLREGRAERAPVKIGLRDEQHGRIEILSGVSANDMLLTGAAQAVTPGARVEIAGSQNR
jgi:membrane fusion protein, multidrug efflux system